MTLNLEKFRSKIGGDINMNWKPNTRKGFLIGSVVIVMGGLISTSGVAEEKSKEENLFKNPGFEEGVTGWGVWKDAVVDDKVSHSGKNSVCLKPIQTAGSRLVASLPIGAGYGKFKSNVTYTLSFWAKGEPATGWEKTIQGELLLEKDIDKVVLAVKPKIDEGTTTEKGWVQFKAEFQIPEEVVNSPKAYYYFTIWTPKIDTHTIWLDDFKFMEVKAKTP